MSELLDKQVDAQKEKIFGGSHKLPQAHEKVCDEMKQRKKAVAIDTNLLVALRAIDLLLTPTPSRDHMLVHY